VKRNKPFIDHTTKGKTIKKFEKFLVNLLIVFVETLLSEVKCTCHLLAFMITSDHENVLIKVYLQSTEENHYFNRKISSIDIITEKYISVVLRTS